MTRLRLIALVMSSVFGLHAVADEPAPGKQVEQRLDLGSEKFINYLLYLPEDYEAGKKSACLLFLHGRGESNGPLSLVKKWGPPRLLDQGVKLPYIVVSPQCPKQPASWSQAEQQSHLVKLLDHIEKTYAVDQGRVYLTGLSMGGGGSWRLLATHPDRFAAVAPVCGRTNTADAEKLKDVPIWVWHGLKDTVIRPSESQTMVDAIRAVGGKKIIYTTLEGIGHNSWSATYASPELYQWFSRHSLEVVKEAK